MELVSLDEPVERAFFVKAAQMNRPFDDRASAAELQVETVFRNRNEAELKAWGIGFIDGKLALASPAPLVESREVHERKPHRPFDLVNILASEEHRGAMGVDANNGLAKFMRRGVDQEREDVALVEAGLLFHVGSLQRMTRHVRSSYALKAMCVRVVVR